MDMKSVNYFIFVLIMVVFPCSTNADHDPFVWKSCSSPNETIQIVNLTVYQNGSNYIYASGKFSIDGDIQSPIKGKLSVKKKVLGMWIPIPCVSNFGSCTYDDICQLTPYNGTCPDYLSDVPCHCPLLQGNYTFNSLPLDVSILPKAIEDGLYTIKLILNQGGKEIMCLKMTIDL